MFHKLLLRNVRTFQGGKLESDEDPFEEDVLELSEVDPGVGVVLGASSSSSIIFGTWTCSSSHFHTAISLNITSLELTK